MHKYISRHPVVPLDWALARMDTHGSRRRCRGRLVSTAHSSTLALLLALAPPSSVLIWPLAPQGRAQRRAAT